MTPANIGEGGRGGCQPPRYRVARGPDAGGGPGGGVEDEREIKVCVSYGGREREREREKVKLDQLPRFSKISMD